MSTIAISIPFTYPYALSFFHIHQLINIVAIVVSFLEFVACLHTSYTHRMIGFKLIGITFSIFFAKLFWFFSNCCTYFISRIRGMHCFNYSNTNTKITSHTHKYFVSREYYSFVVFFSFLFSFFIMLFGFSFTRNYMSFVDVYRFHGVWVALSFTEYCAQIKPNTHRKKMANQNSKVFRISGVRCVVVLMMNDEPH